MIFKKSPPSLAGDGRAMSKDQRKSHSTKRLESEGRSAALQGLSGSIQRGRRIVSDPLNKTTLAASPAVLARLLPDRDRLGMENIALNPRRATTGGPGTRRRRNVRRF
jgi:hypothetical protein